MDPLIGKAYRGALHHPDDVFDLPETMTAHMVAGKVSRQAEQMAKLVPVSSQQQEPQDEQPQISLVRLLYNCWGKQFFAIGLLKLLNDCAGFAGPLLLHAVVDFMETPGQPALEGYLYALLLALSRSALLFLRIILAIHWETNQHPFSALLPLLRAVTSIFSWLSWVSRWKSNAKIIMMMIND